MDPVVDAARVVREFLASPDGATDALTEIMRLAASAAGAEMAGLTWRSANGSYATIGATSTAVLEIDDAQYRAGDGPCVESATQASTEAIHDTATPGRWPEFRDAAARRGVRSSLSIPVVLAGSPSGALNVYRSEPGTFDDTVGALLPLVASQAAVVATLDLRNRELDDLRRALESRSVIDQAKGVIMGATGCDPDEAFDIMRMQSQTENRKLREIAAEIVARQRRSN